MTTPWISLRKPNDIILRYASCLWVLTPATRRDAFCLHKCFTQHWPLGELCQTWCSKLRFQPRYQLRNGIKLASLLLLSSCQRRTVSPTLWVLTALISFCTFNPSYMAVVKLQQPLRHPLRSSAHTSEFLDHRNEVFSPSGIIAWSAKIVPSPSRCLAIIAVRNRDITPEASDFVPN
jgi:hypothetical protein